MRAILVLTAIFFQTIGLLGQSIADFPETKFGQWQQHLPWQRAVFVTQSATHVYYASEWAVLELDKADRIPRFITKIEGLTDVGISRLGYNHEADMLVIAYTNSNIDLYKPADGSVVSLPFIRTNLNLSGDKKIYDIAFDGSFAYLATGFGVVKIDLARAEIVYTVFTNVAVHSFTIYEQYFYIGTEDGLYRLPETDPSPADFGRWEMLGAENKLPEGVTFGALKEFGGYLYAGAEKELYRFNGDTAVLEHTNANYPAIFLTTEGKGLVIGWSNPEGPGLVEYLPALGGSFINITPPCEMYYPYYAIEDGEKRFWMADISDDYRYFDLNTGQCDRFRFNSPYNHFANEIAVSPDGNTTYIATPGAANNLSALYRNYGIYVYKNGSWERWYEKTIPEIDDSDDIDKDLWRVVLHPELDKIYFGSFFGGLLEFENGAYSKRFTQYNSILKNAGASGSGRTAIGGLAFDDQGNLWISNYSSTAPVAVLKSDGTLRNFTASPVDKLLQVAVDNNGYKWFVVGLNGGVLVYDSGTDIDSPADDRYRLINTTNSDLPTNTVNCVAVDLEGDVWVGTQEGVITFECGSNVFDSDCTGRRRIVTVDGFNGYLLETEDVRTIAVDGANRKWFGTTNGIFVQSPDGLTQEGRYTVTNSPLFDNTVRDIVFNNKTGEVWMATEKGVQTLRSDATEGGRVHSPSVYTYPNPVLPGYDGPIAIYGLARDSNVKITDVAGNLVYEGTSLGGQAVWNGRDYKGKRAASGVYLIFATSSNSFDEPDGIVAKVVILN